MPIAGGVRGRDVSVAVAQLGEPHDEGVAVVLAVPTRGGAHLITAVDVSTWTGRRDRAMLMLAALTGLRASELVGLTASRKRTRKISGVGG